MSGGENINIENTVKNLKSEGITAENFQEKVLQFNDIQDISKIDGIEGFSSTEKNIKTLLEKKNNIEKQKEILTKIVEQLKDNEDIKKIEESSEKIDEAKTIIIQLTQEQTELKEKSEELQKKLDVNLDKSIKINEKENTINSKTKEIKKKIKKEKDNNKLDILNGELNKLNEQLKKNTNDNNTIKETNIKIKSDKLKIESKSKEKNESLDNTKEILIEETENISDLSSESSCDKAAEMCSTAIKNSESAFNISEFATETFNATTTNLIEVKNISESVEEVVKINEEESKKNKEEINKSINEITNSLSFGLKYEINKLAIESFRNDIKLINSITDNKKFIEIIKQLSPEELKKINFKDLNIKIKTNLDSAINYSKIKEKPLNYVSINEIDIKNLSYDEIISLYGVINNDAFQNILLDTINSSNTEQEFKKHILESKYINQDQKDKYLKEIESAITYHTNDINKYKDLNYNINNVNNNTGNILEKELYKFTESKKETNYLLLDNYFQDIIKKDHKKFIQLLGKQSGMMLKLPKTMDIIKENNYILNSFIEENHIIYQYIPEKNKIEENNSITYIESILKHKKEGQNINLQISKVKIKNFKQAQEIFGLLEGKVNITDLLKYTEIRVTMMGFMNNNEKEMNNLSGKNKEFFNKIFSEINKYDVEMNVYKNKFDNSNLNKTLSNSNISKMNKLFNNEDFIKMLEEQKPGILGAIVGISRISLGDGGKKEKYDKYISQIAEKIDTPDEFDKILTKINTFIQKANNEQIKEDENTPLKDNDYNILKQSNSDFVQTNEKGEKNIKYSGIDNEFTTFITLKREKAQQKGENFNASDYINEFIKEKGLSNLSQEWILKITEHIKTKEKAGKFNKLVKKAKEDPTKIYEAYKDGNKDKIDELWKDIDKEYYEDIKTESIEYEKKQLSETSTEKKDQYDRLKDTKYPLDKKNGTVTIFENGKETKITLTTTERLLINKNPEVLENIVDFYKTLDKIGLSKLWTIKESLFGSIQNAKGIGFKVDENYLSENEIKIFLNSILKSVGEEEISPVFTLNNFISVIEQKNKTQIGGGEAIVNTTYKETYIENKLFSNFVPREGTIIGFNKSKFEKAILNNNKKSNENTTK